MTAKEKLRQAVEHLSEAQAADLLELLERSPDLDGEAATEILDGIDGAYERAQLGREQARSGQTTSLDDLNRAAR